MEAALQLHGHGWLGLNPPKVFIHFHDYLLFQAKLSIARALH